MRGSIVIERADHSSVPLDGTFPSAINVSTSVLTKASPPFDLTRFAQKLSDMLDKSR